MHALIPSLDYWITMLQPHWKLMGNYKIMIACIIIIYIRSINRDFSYTSCYRYDTFTVIWLESWRVSALWNRAREISKKIVQNWRRAAVHGSGALSVMTVSWRHVLSVPGARQISLNISGSQIEQTGLKYRPLDSCTCSGRSRHYEDVVTGTFHSPRLTLGTFLKSVTPNDT